MTAPAAVVECSMPGPENSRRLYELLARSPLGADRIDQPGYAERLANALKADLEAVLTNDIWVHGRRIQSMFEAMVVAFDHFTLIKTEDAGPLHPEDVYSLPDFRLVLKDKSQILVEVKNVWCSDPREQLFTIRTTDLEKKMRYAEATGAPLKLAIYWARWGIWTLIDPKHLRDDGASKTVTMLQAVPFNETACFGDVTIGTRAPLTFRVEADRTKERTISPDGKVSMTIGAIILLCEGTALTGLDSKLALLLIQFGEWQGEDAVAVTDGALVDSIEYHFNPGERPEGGPENFDMIGHASRMFARYYSLRTVDAGRVIRTGVELEPGLFRVLTVGDGTGHSIPLWRFYLQPATPEQVRAA